MLRKFFVFVVGAALVAAPLAVNADILPNPPRPRRDNPPPPQPKPVPNKQQQGSGTGTDQQQSTQGTQTPKDSQ